MENKKQVAWIQPVVAGDTEGAFAYMLVLGEATENNSILKNASRVTCGTILKCKNAANKIGVEVVKVIS